MAFAAERALDFPLASMTFVPLFAVVVLACCIEDGWDAGVGGADSK